MEQRQTERRHLFLFRQPESQRPSAVPAEGQGIEYSTSFYLPPEDVDNLRTAAAELMKQSLDYRNLLAEFAAHPNPDTIFAAPPPDVQEFKPLNEKKKQ